MIEHTAPRLSFVTLTVACALSSSPARCEPAVPEPERPASDAQPGLHRVPVAERATPALAATLGYGFTEPTEPDDGVHHRGSLRLGAATALTSWLNLGATADSRYDAHPDDTGFILDVGLAARAFRRVDDSRFGLELKVWVPGAERFSTTVSATSFEARLLWAQDARNVRLAAGAGYRVDRGANAGRTAPTLSRSDRLAFGLSDFDAALFGVGVLVPLGRTELLVELSADVLVGAGAPSVLESPLRASAGVRQLLSPRLSLDTMLEASASQRPLVAPEAPLVPIEPRITLLTGLRYVFSAPAAAPASSSSGPVEKPPAPAPSPIQAEPPAKESVIDVVVTDGLGETLPEAQVRMVCNGAELSPRSADGRYRAEHVPYGECKLAVEAPGFEPQEQIVQVDAPRTIDVRLERLAVQSQVRGRVRSFHGQGLLATVRIEPLGKEISTDSAGSFELDLPPGKYEVVIAAPGYATQRRAVRLEVRAVVILNADLARGK